MIIGDADNPSMPIVKWPIPIISKLVKLRLLYFTR